MKIGIITFHRTTNFGSVLQTYGLYKKISDFGYDCEIIDYRCPAIEERENLENIGFSLSPRKIGRAILLQPALNKKAEEIKKFSKIKMRLSPPYSPHTIANANGIYDKFFVGSDIVWGRDITKFDYNYFLEFVQDNRKKYAFSSSVGDTSSAADDEIIGRLLSNFVQICVREKDMVEWVYNLTEKEACWVCDPTMLLNKDDWKIFVSLKKPKDNYALVYFNNQNGKALSDAKQYAKRAGKEVFYINYGFPVKDVHNIKPKTIEEFLSWIYYADRVFTSSYHGMLFSIYFEREFLFYTRAHKSRVLSLADRLGLTDYCGDCIEEADCLPISYQDVTEKVSVFRDESLAMLQKMLSEPLI